MSGTERLNAALAGRYKIAKQLGQGGMATVYLAHDEKHDRKVAVKVLKPELAAVLGAERFVVEIKTTAALQHPHILPLFDSGTADGFLYYVMPYIEGETLRGKLNRETQFSVDEAVRITTQVADALDYAHRHGVIHRDIKPENILLHDGRPMVADFGIALAVSAAAGGRMTETGLSLGTPHYMSPEQATAEKEITGRSDTYSLASVLFEMLTGQPPHMGASAQQIIMKIITEHAEPVTKLRKAVPPNVAAALEKALEKLPADRFETAKQFGEALVNRTFTSATFVPIAESRVPSSRLALIVAASAAAVFAITTTWALTRPRPAAPVTRYEVNLPEGKGIGSTQWSPMAVSPDGSKLVYVGETGRLYIRARNQLDPMEIVGTDGAFNPFWSPDGQRVGFMTGAAGSAEIKCASLSGGPPTLITSTGVGGPGVAWGVDGYVYFDASGVGPLRRVRDTGGAGAVPEDASVRDSAAGELQHNWPDPLPNGRGVLIVIDRGGPGVNVSTANDIAVLDLATHKHKVLVRGVYAKYAASGHIVYVTSGGVLMAVPFDQDKMELTGNAVALQEGIRIRRGGGGVDMTLSASGTLWYGFGASFNNLEVAWATRSGVTTVVDPGMSGDFEALALSPDGTRLALGIVDATGEQIWVKNVSAAGGTIGKLTFDGINTAPRWHPDGKRILYASQFVAARRVHAVRADGASPAPVPILSMPGSGRIYGARWSPDARWIVFEHLSATNGRDISAVRVGETTFVALVTSKFADRDPSVSPDGRWLLYSSSTTGTVEAYVRPFPATTAGLYQVSSGGGFTPKWSRDGREIYFRNTNGQLMRAAVGSGNTFTSSDQRPLFSLSGVAEWDVAPDGRFVLLRDKQAQQRRGLVVVENFLQELKTRVPR
jgi:Tol biopolymer transport system component/tRNA A-37 threonylcarbamoyl transferase component Bud32